MLKELWITPLEYKNKILKQTSTLIPRTFMTIEGFKDSFEYRITEQALIYIMHKCDLSYENAMCFLENMRLIEDREYSSSRLRQLKDLKSDLLAKKYISPDKSFINLLARKSVVIAGYPHTKRLEKLISAIRMFTEVRFTSDTYSRKELDICAYESHAKETEATFNYIRSLLSKGIDINKIVIVGDEENIFSLKLYASLYKIPLIFPNWPAISYVIIQEFLELIKDNDYVLSYEMIIKKYPLKAHITDVLLQTINKYEEGDEVLFFTRELSRKKIRSNLADGVRVVSSDFQSDDSEYVLWTNFVNEVYPRKHRNDRFFSDLEAAELGIDTTDDLNYSSREELINKLYSIKNIRLSYGKKRNEISTPLSDLFDSLLVNIIDDVPSAKYSLLLDKVNGTMHFDNLSNYDIKDRDLGMYVQYSGLRYKEYRNDFTGLGASFKKEFNLSYSALDAYYKCPFSYYLNSILRVNYLDSTFYARQGEVIHEILEQNKAYSDTIELVREYEDKFETAKERFFFRKKLADLPVIASFNEELKANSSLDQEMHEKRITVQFDDFLFKGFIDKIMYTEKNNVNYIAIIDYKTGSINLSLNDLSLGSNLQLPVYVYLVFKSKLLNEMKLIGIYFQELGYTPPKRDRNTTLVEYKERALRLRGYTTEHGEIISLLDPGYQDSRFIHSMRVTSTGKFYHHAKILSDKEIAYICQTVERLIYEAGRRIKDGDFAISPLIINGSNKSCEYCSFKNICYRKYSDFRRVPKTRTLKEAMEAEKCN